ncbi:hypothetical protein GH733_016333 [Mirounga leonina]|nr:hypothetical protein GH733_016333 [Mirounga leonina]
MSCQPYQEGALPFPIIAQSKSCEDGMELVWNTNLALEQWKQGRGGCQSIPSTKAEIDVCCGPWKSPPGKVKEPMKVAIDAGYHHIDCACVYQDKNEVGKAIQEKVVKQEDFFIISKLGPTFESILVKEADQKTAKNLDYSLQRTFPPEDHKGNDLTSKLTFLGAWEAVEELVGEGLVRAFAVFDHFQIKRLLNKPRLKCKQVTDQIECPPCLTGKNGSRTAIPRASLSQLKAFWALPKDFGPSQRIFTSGGSQNSGDGYEAQKTHSPGGLELQSSGLSPTCIVENFEAFDFKWINDEEMVTIPSFNRNWRAWTRASSLFLMLPDGTFVHSSPQEIILKSERRYQRNLPRNSSLKQMARRGDSDQSEVH